MRLIIALWLIPLCMVGQIKESEIELVTQCSKKKIVVGECTTISYFVITDTAFVFRPWAIDSVTRLISKSATASGNVLIYEKLLPKKFREKVLWNGRTMSKYELYSISICPMDEGVIKIPSVKFQFNKGDNLSPIILNRSTKAIPVEVARLSLTGVSEFMNKPLIGDFEIEESINTANYEADGYIDHKLALSGYGDLFGLNVPSHSDSLVDFVVTGRDLSFDFFANDLWTKREIVVQIRPKQEGHIKLSEYFNWKAFSSEEQAIERLSVNTTLEIPKLSLNSIDLINEPELIVLVDISESMQLEDYPINRMNEALTVLEQIEEFKRTKVLAFAGDFLWLDPTQRDTSVIRLSRKRGTAVCDALWEALNWINENQHLNREVIVIGDGDDTASHLSIDFIGARAEQLGIKIHSIAIGHSGKVKFGHDFFGRARYVENVFNSETLESLSVKSGGKFHHLVKSEQLNEILSDILKL